MSGRWTSDHGTGTMSSQYHWQRPTFRYNPRLTLVSLAAAEWKSWNRAWVVRAGLARRRFPDEDLASVLCFLLPVYLKNDDIAA